MLPPSTLTLSETVNTPHSRMGTWLGKGLATVLLAATSYAGVRLMFQSETSLSAMIPMLTMAKKTGLMPDGEPVRTYYTGVEVLDDILTGLVVFFTLLMDGHDDASHRFSLWFLPQIAPLMVHMYWETTKRRSPFARIPTLFGLAMQLYTGGIMLPIYYALSALTSSAVPKQPRGDAEGKARALLPAVILAFFVPSVALFLSPQSVPLDTKQIVAAVWQFFPLWMAILYNVFRVLLHTERSAPPGSDAVSDAQTRAALKWVKRAYLFCGLVCAAAHIYVLYTTLVTDASPGALLKVFVPYTLYHYLPVPPPASDVADYRRATRQLFQFDWLCMTVASLVFFGWSHVATARQGKKDMGLGGWLARVAVLSVLGGPGAAISWAAFAREERILALQRVKKE